jgi:ferredoxin
MSHQLTIEPIGQTIEVEDGQTVLDACLRAGIWLPHACCHGLCATCKVVVRDGEVEHGEASPFALMDFERDEGKTLACCATLQSDVVIEAEIDEDPDAELIPVRDFEGTVARIEQLTPTIKASRCIFRRGSTSTWRSPGWASGGPSRWPTRPVGATRLNSMCASSVAGRARPGCTSS